MSILGIDPGKTGGFCLMSDCGERFRFWPMPLVGGKVSSVGIAQLYNEIKGLCKEPPKVFIEKIFSKPTDAVSQADYDSVRDFLDVVKAQGELSRENLIVPTLPKIRMDGRVGNLTYAQGAGRLEMCALWGWSITLVSPVTWTKRLHAGIDGKLPPKEKSMVYVSQRWPHLYQQGSPIWPGKTKAPHLGLLDALMIAEHGRTASQ